MLHVYGKKPKEVRKRTRIPTRVIQVAAPPFVWIPSHEYNMLRGAFFACLNQTKQMHLDRDIERLMEEKVDTTGLHIITKEELDGTPNQDLQERCVPADDQ